MHHKIYGLIAAFITVVCLLGCGFFQRDAAEPQATLRSAPVGRGLIYKTAITLSPAPATPIEQRLGGIHLQNLLQTITAKNKHIKLYAPTQEGYPPFMHNLLRAADSAATFAALEPARRMGFQAVLLASIGGIKTSTQSHNYYLFSRTTYHITCSTAIEVYDPFSGSKIFCEFAERTMKIGSTEYDDIQTGTFHESETLEKYAAKSARTLAQKTVKRLLQQPWKVLVTAVDGDRLLMTTDSDAGLAPDQRLWIFEARRELENRYGQRFVVPGGQIAQAHITSVDGGLIEARLDEAAEVQAGDLAVLIR